MPAHVSSRDKGGGQISPEGGVVAKKPIELTPEQQKQLEDAFAKAILDTIGTPKNAWISGGFSKE